MPIITSLDSLDQAIRRAGGTPKVLEALWDGDTQGWHLCLSVYTEHGIWPLQRTECHFLGSVVLGTDSRLFNGQVPPWPEAELVKVYVAQTQVTSGLTLYLPSEEPDDECPRWSERAQARACLDCGKLGIPTDSPYLPKDICYTCHLRREQHARIQQETPYDEGVHLYVYQKGAYRPLAYATAFDSFAIAPYVEPALLQDFEPDTIHVVTLGQDALVKIQARLAEALEEKLTHYEPAEQGTHKSRFYHFTTIAYQGVAYELEVKWHDLHGEVSHLFREWEAIRETTGAADAKYQLYFKRGITYRDDSVLRYLKYPALGPRTIEQIVQQYRGLLAEQEVRRTLTKLEAMQCLEIVNREVTLTQTGSNIV